MKLEMRAWDLDVKLELEDDDAVDQLEVLSTVKSLLEILNQFEKVNVSIVQVDEVEESEYPLIDGHSDNM